jgi:phosphate-selective porin OprO/OprP
VIENKDVSGNEASAYTVGVNYYATPNTRFMVEYVKGETDVGTPDKKAAAVTARAQFNF